MNSRAIVIATLALLLGGCDLVRSLLPRNGTTVTDAQAALSKCEIEPDSIQWSVSTDGTFAFGRKSADAPPMPKKQFDCLMLWIETNRIKVAVIGWETNAL